MYATLWASSDAGQWQDVLDGYWQAVEGYSKAKLLNLDRWFHNQLPNDLRDSNRQPAHLTQPELVKLVEWKLTRGKARPNLLNYAKAADPAAVQAASTAAFDLLAQHRGKALPPPETIKAALSKLTVLKGVGPATASAILEAYDDSVAFASDQAMLGALGSKDYTVAIVLDLTAALRAKAKQLSKGGGREWSVKEVEQCLFAATVSAAAGGGGSSKEAVGSGSGGKALGAKRKR